MEDTTETRTETESSRQELCRLIRWSKDNPEDWYRICNAESYEPDLAYLSELIERLYKEKLYTAIYFVLFSNHYVTGVDWAITKTTNECFLDIPAEVLIERFCRNLNRKAEELAREEQPVS